MSVHANGKNRASPATSVPTMTLSIGAIVGIVVAGAILLFAVVAFLLMKLAKQRDQRRMSMHPEVTMESGTTQIGPRRLRKRSVVGDPGAAIVDKEDEVGMEESRSRRSSLQVVVSPTRARGGSFSAGEGSAHGSVDTLHQVAKTRSPDKQRGYGVYQNRRKTSWIDEDALHGPTIISPRKPRQKHKRKVSWFDGGLGRSLSRLSTRSGMGEASPTLPYTDGDTGQQMNTPAENADERRSGEVSQSAQFTGYTAMPRQSQRQTQVYVSPQRAYGPSNNPSPESGSNTLAKSPPDIIHNPRYRDRVSFQAAQQLAGGARLPAPINIPQGQTQTQPQPQPQTPRNSTLNQSATDTELTEILRMTAERLRDGNRSARRQTMMAPHHARGASNNNEGGRVNQGDYAEYSHEGEERGDVSPIKSHKSAPATMSYAELEGSTPKRHASQRTPNHARQASHISRNSQVSMISEADSLVAPKRDSFPDVRTALSSPSRVIRSTEPTPSPQGPIQVPRPFSNGSTLSSALSTLYSMEETSIRSPPAGDLKLDGGAERRARNTGLSTLDRSDTTRGPEAEWDRSHKSQFDNNEIPPPLRIRRGTLGRGRPSTFVGSRSPSHRPAEPTDLANRKSSFTIHAPDDTEDPFAASAKPQNPARLSKVFSPLPTELPSRHAADKSSTAQENQTPETPTPSPTGRRVLLSPRTILNSPSFANRERAASPAISEAGLSSVYDSYIYTYTETPGRTMANDAAAKTSISSEMLASGILGLGRGSRIGFRMPNYDLPTSSETTSKSQRDSALQGPPGSPLQLPPQPQLPPRRSMPSDGSIYSQDQDSDQVPPLRASTLLQRSKSVRVSAAISELRRMNSQLSTLSDQSVASSTVPGMRGGGFSPGRESGGVRNYLSLGGELKSSADGAGGGIVRVNRGSHVRRHRRGTVVLQGGEARRLGGNGGLSFSDEKPAGPLVTHAARLGRREEVAVKRSSVESLYDSKGFLKG